MVSYYDKEQRANNISLLYLLLKELIPERNITLKQIADDYDSVLDEVMQMLD